MQSLAWGSLSKMVTPGPSVSLVFISLRQWGLCSASTEFVTDREEEAPRHPAETKCLLLRFHGFLEVSASPPR